MSQQLVPGMSVLRGQPPLDEAFTITDEGLLLLRVPAKLGMAQLKALAEGVQSHPAFERATTGIVDLRQGRAQLTVGHVEACASKAGGRPAGPS
ncbi:MAG TPA: hypothetical protein ENJ31_11610 [Anaerolineae bacterium]|nr:hypothetical protein [Anaerolineae bacterium]